VNTSIIMALIKGLSFTQEENEAQNRTSVTRGVTAKVFVLRVDTRSGRPQNSHVTITRSTVPSAVGEMFPLHHSEKMANPFSFLSFRLHREQAALGAGNRHSTTVPLQCRVQSRNKGGLRAPAGNSGQREWGILTGNISVQYTTCLKVHGSPEG
jgi:hypothetical protein